MDQLQTDFRRDIPEVTGSPPAGLVDMGCATPPAYRITRFLVVSNLYRNRADCRPLCFTFATVVLRFCISLLL